LAVDAGRDEFSRPGEINQAGMTADDGRRHALDDAKEHTNATP
jgi:hypothetical protein